MPKLKQNATPSIIGIIYQFYVALEKCFDLNVNEKLYIEKYGDITISDRYQIEVKNYEDDLTNLHENIWKTLANWLDNDFNSSFYNVLILLTTQQFSVNSNFKNWNKNHIDEKLKIIETIAKNYSKKVKKNIETEKYINLVITNNNRGKLISILQKFSIYDSSPKEIEYYEKLKTKYGTGVLMANRGNYINSLLGYIISPEDRTSIGWEISHEKFSQRAISLTEQFCSGTKIFPRKVSSNDLTNEEIQEKLQHLFVKKIDDIKHVDAKNDAIVDYIRTNKTISEELRNYSIDKKHYNSYEDELLRSYKPLYRIASRKAKTDEIISQSQNFYDETISSPAPNFLNFNDTPIFFKNGILHNIADDEQKEFIWKLKVNIDE